MDRNLNQLDQADTKLDNPPRALPLSDSNFSQETPLDRSVSDVSNSTQELAKSSKGQMSSTNQRYPSEVSPPPSPPNISSVVTMSSDGKKNKKILWVVLVTLLLMAISVGAYFLYIGLSEKYSDPDQSLTNLPSPILVPTKVLTMPTLTPIPQATGSAVLSLCDELVGQATRSAHQEDYCQGIFCREIETEEECLEVDVVATSGGVLSTENVSDGVGDCIWDDLASGFGSKCKVKYD